MPCLCPQPPLLPVSYWVVPQMPHRASCAYNEEEDEDEEDEGDKPVRASLARFASAFLCRLTCTGCAEQPPGPFLEVRPPP